MTLIYDEAMYECRPNHDLLYKVLQSASVAAGMSRFAAENITDVARTDFCTLHCMCVCSVHKIARCFHHTQLM